MMYTRFYVEGLHGHLDVSQDNVKLVRCNLANQELFWSEDPYINGLEEIT